jgi:hypothetical protein
MNDTNELRAAAERGRKLYRESPAHVQQREQCLLLGLLSEAYLAEHPADDGERATERWVSAAIDWHNRDSRHDVLLSVVRLGITKVAFRKLCVDIGITLKEGGL